MTRRVTDKMVKFAGWVNRSDSPAEAARKAGYGPSEIQNAGRVVERCRRAGLLMSEEEAAAPLDIMRSEVTAADWERIVAKAKQDAISGDRFARQWLSDYWLGKPTHHVDVTSDGKPLSVPWPSYVTNGDTDTPPESA